MSSGEDFFLSISTCWTGWAHACCRLLGQGPRFHDISFEPSSVNLGDSCLPNPNTPRKINMEHNHAGLVQIIFLSKWVICRFHVNLPGCKVLAFCKGVLPKSPATPDTNKKTKRPCWNTYLPNHHHKAGCLLPWKDLLHPTTLTTLQETNIARKIHPFWMVSTMNSMPNLLVHQG